MNSILHNINKKSYSVNISKLEIKSQNYDKDYNILSIKNLWYNWQIYSILKKHQNFELKNGISNNRMIVIFIILTRRVMIYLSNGMHSEAHVRQMNECFNQQMCSF